MSSFTTASLCQSKTREGGRSQIATIAGRVGRRVVPVRVNCIPPEFCADRGPYLPSFAELRSKRLFPTFKVHSASVDEIPEKSGPSVVRRGASIPVARPAHVPPRPHPDPPPGSRPDPHPAPPTSRPACTSANEAVAGLAVADVARVADARGRTQRGRGRAVRRARRARHRAGVAGVRVGLAG